MNISPMGLSCGHIGSPYDELQYLIKFQSGSAPPMFQRAMAFGRVPLDDYTFSPGAKDQNVPTAPRTQPKMAY